MFILIVSLVLSLLPAACGAAYDYIIVGGGTSGLLLSMLLSADPNVTVAVLEAGLDGRDDPLITVPENEGAIVGTAYDWAFTSVAQSNLYQDASIAYPLGRTLGGSSAMNFMIYHRASTVEFDAWESVLNISGWNWETIYTAFKAAENFTAAPTALEQEGLTSDAAYHGFSGPVAGTMSRNVFSLWEDYVVPSLEELGVPKLIDADGGETTGVRYVPLAVNATSYTRSYSATAYTAVEGRSNLDVLTNTTVKRLLWSDNSVGELAVANAVEYVDPSTGSLATLNASNIILSAGSIQSAPLLESSGIGDPLILSTLDIPVVVDLPAVGTLFQDHLTYAGSFSFNTTLQFTGDQYIQALQDYAQPSRFLSSEDYAFATDLLFNVAEATPPPGASNASLTMLRTLWTADEPLIEFGWFLGFVTGYVLHPLSSGTIHAAPSSTQPAIDPNFNGAQINGTAFDLWLLSKALQYYATKVASAGPLGAVGAEFSVSGDLPFDTFQNTVFAGLSSGSHPTGGCVMMPRDQGGVVDENLQVYGTANVRVVDASVVPVSPGQHTMGLAYAIAVRAAEILRAGL
ncbi:hypothetical protein N0V93_008294 [Gnomoniopsis smithogilvyi]|uniref:Glucose-methanol-choline oxidoreductase N-terminal domain-containing protein n=1 Tax=Gnomoniopsis smithogilvyi TaxID=1191159 RepID=A0A9W8YLF8_9PEZI|nr:hypothetical protein N0V93_008294 [Gnomoniopsis smithogilvyi]